MAVMRAEAWIARTSRAMAGFVLFLAFAACPATAQQLADPNVDVSVAKPAYAKGAGPLVLIDAAHHNFHTADGRFKPFADLLRNDGFKVEESKAAFTDPALARGKVMVIANALNEANVEKWELPTPSAFTPPEITALKKWVENGGALLLAADHMPCAGAAEELGKAFGFGFVNGFAFHIPPKAGDFFTKEAGTLKDDAVTKGITAIESFTGSAFKVPQGARPLMVFPAGYQVLTPRVAWQFSPSTPQVDAQGLAQGAVMNVGKGRIAVFGEAGMFSAQTGGQGADAAKFGFNAPEAPENKQFILNVVHWLAG